MDRRDLFLISVVVSIAVVLGGAIYVNAREKSMEPITEKESKKLAEEFVLNSPTYKFDGFDLEFKETLYPDIAEKPYLWAFVFEFKSLHAGYGDRTGQNLPEVITPHEAHITVDDGKVTTALLDLEWDMIKQKFVE